MLKTHYTQSGIGSYLLKDNLIDESSLKQAMQLAQQNGSSLIQTLIETHLLSSKEILNCLAKYFGLPIYDLDQHLPLPAQEQIIKLELIIRHQIIPIRREEQRLLVGIADPSNQAGLTAIRFHTGLALYPMLVAEDKLRRWIKTYCESKPLEVQLEATLSQISTQAEMAINPIEHDFFSEDNEPVTTYLDQLILNAIEKHISDIHLESFEYYCRIRFRRDGLLHEVARIPLHLAHRIYTRLKIMANLNIAEKRVPQDGRLSTRFDSNKEKIDIRISTCPTLYGEKLVLRLLNHNATQLSLDYLGLTATQHALLIRTLSQTQGLILVTGPTGSGKTYTLYAALDYLNDIEKNIITVEDPIEIKLEGINQIHVNPKIGLDFATVLRALMRQDPDIIMIGEIRDKETAHIAVQAAQTGHLVLSTVHTHSAREVILRLKSMGIKEQYLRHVLLLIIGQRLVRTLCPYCKKSETISENDDFSYLQAYCAQSCEHCHSGYRGRTGVFEMYTINQMHNFPEDSDQIKQNLWDSGMDKLKSGLTSIAELKRVLGDVTLHNV